ncbi:ABC transporter substrate-binding protein [Amaricoccus macauensis]|uniref:ABC transporter substrate-binding protein n=1 Tax=Amaricoccus macauensis TaxID=57001 RepID=UPI003C7C0D3A
MSFARNISVLALFSIMLGLAPAALSETQVLRAAVLEFGTVNWELDTIEHYGLDEANGFDLEVQGMAGSSAAQVAFQGGETDVIVSDWLWVARQRANGKDYVFIPYSKAVGGLMVPGDSDALTIADLNGGKIGIAGGPLDKSWLILRAFAEQEHRMDLMASTEQVFGAPPLIYKTALAGDLDGAINFWHYMAKMEAGGMELLVSVEDAALALGLDPNTPLLGYVVREELIESNPSAVAGLATASREAKELLAEDAEAWERLRPRMNAASDAEFDALVSGWRAGIPEAGPIDTDAADRMLRFMAELGGEDLLGSVKELPDGVFYQPGS